MTITKNNPPAPRQSHDWASVAAELRANPGEWYKLDDPHPKVSTHFVRRGQPQAFAPPGSFDAVIGPRKSNPGTWLRYLGEPLEPWLYFQGDGRSFDELDRAPLD